MSGPAVRLVMYSKEVCGLCDELLELIHKLQEQEALSLEVIKIDGDEALEAQYGSEVPVLFIEGRKSVKGRTTEPQLRKMLKRARRSLEDAAAASSLDELEGGAALPHPIFRIAWMALAVLGFAYALWLGYQDQQTGRLRLAAALFDVETRSTAPLSFELESLVGDKVRLSDYSDKVLLVNFWATWCPPCVEEMPSMERFSVKLQEHPSFALLAVSADDEWKPVRQFFESHAPAFPVLLDAGGKIAKEYGTTQFPETYVIVDGRIRGFIEGPRDWDTWYAEAYVRALLDQKQPMVASR